MLNEGRYRSRKSCAVPTAYKVGYSDSRKQGEDFCSRIIKIPERSHKMGEESNGRLTTWEQLRFSIVGELLARPPEAGELQSRLKELASRRYRHPTKKSTWITFGVSTIERWYYQALRSPNPIEVLSRQIRSDAGITRVISPALLVEIEKQYGSYKNWSYQLHADNLSALVEKRPELGKAPSYSTLLRHMKGRGWTKLRSCKKGKKQTAGQKKAQERLEQREVRGYESAYVHALWHLDFHEGSLRVIEPDGCWYSPHVLGILDDCSRSCSHIQWYLNETAENLEHSLTQAFYKRGLPSGLMTDNGSAMMAWETRNGLERLSILHETTLPYSPYQNGKQESFWGQIEGRLLPMLCKVEPLTLEFLNQATQAWVEQEYNNSKHTEIGTTPIKRLLEVSDVSRPSPDRETINFAFTIQQTRIQRRSDGTIQIEGVRFEVPSRFRHFQKLTVCYKRWDLSIAYLVDAKTGNKLATIYPQDKTKNADGRRRTLVAPIEDSQLPKPSNNSDPIPPLLRKYLADYAATGLPPAYIPKDEIKDLSTITKEAQNEQQ